MPRTVRVATAGVICRVLNRLLRPIVDPSGDCVRAGYRPRRLCITGNSCQ
jgi:hypothetical protein